MGLDKNPQPAQPSGAFLFRSIVFTFRTLYILWESSSIDLLLICATGPYKFITSTCWFHMLTYSCYTQATSLSELIFSTLQDLPQWYSDHSNLWKICPCNGQFPCSSPSESTLLHSEEVKPLLYITLFIEHNLFSTDRSRPLRGDCQTELGLANLLGWDRIFLPFPSSHLIFAVCEDT